MYSLDFLVAKEMKHNRPLKDIVAIQFKGNAVILLLKN